MRRPPARPAVEALDPRMLPSAVAATATHPARHHAAATPAPVVVLQGTLHETATIASDLGRFTADGSGDLGAVGVATVHYSASPEQVVSGGAAKFDVLTTPGGKIDYTASAHLVPGAGTSVSSAGTYHITGGTGAYAHARGSGAIHVTITPGAAGTFAVATTFG